jgi:hypothetical protein
MVVDAPGRAFVGDFRFDLMGGGAPNSATDQAQRPRRGRPIRPFFHLG